MSNRKELLLTIAVTVVVLILAWLLLPGPDHVVTPPDSGDSGGDTGGEEPKPEPEPEPEPEPDCDISGKEGLEHGQGNKYGILKRLPEGC